MKRSDRHESRPPERSEDSAGEPASGSDASLVALRQRCEEYLAQWQRAQADYQNLRRRMQGEIETAQRRALEPLFEGLFGVLESLELALASPAASPEARSIAEGVRLTRDQLLSALQAQGVEPLPAGGAFDPAVHQAVLQEEAPGEAGRVLETLRGGWTWHGAVLRPAQVKVSVAPSDTRRA